MDSTITKQQSGQKLTNDKRLKVVALLVEHLSKGYYTTHELSKMTGLTRKMIDTYRPVVDEVISKKVVNKNSIRYIQIQRTFNILEMLTKDLNKTTDDKIRQGYYNQLAKHGSNLAQISGINEMNINVDSTKQLVIIRANNNKRPVIDVNETNTDIEKTPDVITIKEEASPNAKQGHGIPDKKN